MQYFCHVSQPNEDYKTIKCRKKTDNLPCIIGVMGQDQSRPNQLNSHQSVLVQRKVKSGLNLLHFIYSVNHRKYLSPNKAKTLHTHNAN